MLELDLNEDQMVHLVRLLMGAAMADGEFDGLEAGEISDILHEVFDGDVPSAVSMEMAKFEVEDFSVQESCDALNFSTDAQRSALIALVTRVTEADSLHDLAESSYIKQVVGAIGGDVEAYEQHMYEVVVVRPPPLPTSTQRNKKR